MNKVLFTPPSSPTLEQLLQRDDVWLGRSQQGIARTGIGTGHETLDACLLHGGWPVDGLIEVCQPGMQGEWQLFAPSLLRVPGLIVLLNPPATPFSQAFIQAGIDLERLLVVSAADKALFMAGFIELARASVAAVFAWQPQETLTYTELRKCNLAAQEGGGLSVMFRPAAAQQQSSPAALRLYARMTPVGLEVTAFKQKGYLTSGPARPVVLSLPDQWQPMLPYHALNQGLSQPTPAVQPSRFTGDSFSQSKR